MSANDFIDSVAENGPSRKLLAFNVTQVKSELD
jgi:hypothetical protein